MTGGMGGYTRSGIAYQIKIEDTRAGAVASTRTDLDIKLFETLAVYILNKNLAPHLLYKNIYIFCDNKTTVKSIVKKRWPLNSRDIHFIVDQICMLASSTSSVFGLTTLMVRIMLWLTVCLGFSLCLKLRGLITTNLNL